MSAGPPFSNLYDLANLPVKGAELTISPGAEESARIAKWLKIEALPSLKASVKLARTPSGRFLFHAHFDADVVQACVVTLEPVSSHLSGDFDRAYELAPTVSKSGRKRNAPPVVALDADDEDAPELLDSLLFDVAAPVLEELSLALDPYPRREGVAFAPPEPPESTPNNPFAILKSLKRS